MGKKDENTGFICKNCDNEVLPVSNGSYRNHCPFCLFSVHVDILPGDRQSDCLGLMKPIGVHYNTQKGWQLIHKCLKCGFERHNIIIDSKDKNQPDDMRLVYNIMNDVNNYRH